MKVFLASSAENEKEDGVQSLLTEYLKHNYKVFHYYHVPSSDHNEHAFTDLMEEINAADVFIGEMSRSSQTLGFQLAHALQISKPCLYLYDEREKGPPAGLIGSIPSRGLKVKKYNKDIYKKVIDSFMAFAEKQLLTARTSFMSTREIDAFLAKEATAQVTSKGELIRQILHRHIENAQKQRQ